MRKLFTIMGLMMIGSFAFAQTIVSTTPENKKVILEEYTGIHCVYCPDGHRTAHEIMTTNPGNAFMIAIHQGGFASPDPGEPDFRTAYGNALAAQYSISSYPNATVNRGTGATSTRATWITWANTILTQSSYVNVGVEAQIDYMTRVLTVHCEVYYTANSPVASNKLNIALLQNYVKGPQVGGSTFNPTMVTSDGLYMHQHMLRELFTGQWGVTINNTNAAANTLKVDTTFTYTVPANYISVDVCLAQLEVVAFVSEGNKTIISGNGCLVTPKPVDDASITAISGLPFLQCSSTNITPTVKLKNIGANTLTTADIIYTIDGGAPVSQSWTGSLVTGDSMIVSLTNPIVPTNGHHVIRCFSALPNGNTDYNYVNDDYFGSYNIMSIYSTTPINEEFTSTTFPPTNWIIDGIYWTRSTSSSFGVGTGSAKMNFYSASAGTINDLYVKGLDLTSGTAHFLSFDHAYAQYAAGDNDRLQVQVSTNCGGNWTDVFNKSGDALKTANPTTTGFTPTSTQWVHNTVDLTPYDGQSNVIVRFHATSAYGNNLYIDKVMTGLGYGVNESENNDKIIVYPNPASDFVNIINATNSSLQIYDVFGKLIASYNISENNHILNVGTFAKGTYLLKITNSEGSISKKITVL